MAYLLDSNVFIEAKNHYYGFKFHPGFWKWLDHANEQGSIFSIKQVRDELMGRQDLLSLWCKNRKSMFVETNDAKTYESMKLLVPWICDNYQPAAQGKFLGCADCVIVAYAHAHNHTVVTIEKPSAGLEVKIPNACKAMDVPLVTPFTMLAAEKVKFQFSP